MKILQAIKNFILNHKIICLVIAAVFAAGGYYYYHSVSSTQAGTKYVLAQAQKDTLISSVSGTGQISASNEVALKTKASGDILLVNVKQGQEVAAGTILAQIDPSDQAKTVRDAQASLDSALLSLEKLQKPADELSLLQAENSLTAAKESKEDAQENLTKAYDDGFNTVASAFLDLSTVMTGLQGVVLGSTFDANKWNVDYYADAVKDYNSLAPQYREDAYDSYVAAREAYDNNFSDYKAASRYSDQATIEALVNETYDTTKKIAQAVKDNVNLIQFYEDQLTKFNVRYSTAADTHLTSLTTYTSKTNTHLSNLYSTKQTIQNDKQAIVEADRTIEEKEGSLADLQAGTDEEDIRSQELSVQQKRNALADARENYANYTIKAPFDGVVSSVDIKKGDSVSSGAAAFSIITKQQIAEISLNEVDITKVKVGQKATLTFDAVEDLTLTGQVAEVDIAGAVSSGVVSYSAQITLDTQDERVKAGMSVTASIITETKTDVLVVPAGAVKTSGGQSYVLAVDSSIAKAALSASTASGKSTSVALSIQPAKKTVVTGSSNDSYVEITSGLEEGDVVVSQTSSSSSSNSSSSSGSSNKNSGGGEMMMMMR